LKTENDRQWTVFRTQQRKEGEEGITAAFDVNIRSAVKEVYSATWSSCTK
jgi:hypothetical protein